MRGRRGSKVCASKGLAPVWSLLKTAIPWPHLGSVVGLGRLQCPSGAALSQDKPVPGCSPWWLSPGEQLTGTCDSTCCWLGGSGVTPSAPEEETCVPRSTRALSPLHPTGGTRWLLLPPGALPPLQIPVFFPAVRPHVLLSRRLSPAGGRAQLGGQTPSPLPASSPRGLAFQSGLRRKQRSCRHALPTHTHTHVRVAGALLINFDQISSLLDRRAGSCKHPRVSRAAPSAQLGSGRGGGEVFPFL